MVQINIPSSVKIMLADVQISRYLVEQKTNHLGFSDKAMPADEQIFSFDRYCFDHQNSACRSPDKQILGLATNELSTRMDIPLDHQIILSDVLISRYLFWVDIPSAVKKMLVYVQISR